MIEVEKKFRLTKRQRDAVVKRLPEIGASLEGEDFEENTLYHGEALQDGSCVLRLRRAGEKATLTFKRRLPGASAIKQQREEETAVADAGSSFASPSITCCTAWRSCRPSPSR